MINFTCPHCGQRTTADLTEADVEYVDLGNGLPDAVFPSTPPGVERQIDQRLCCRSCYDRADPRPLVPGPGGAQQRHGPPDLHPYHPDHHEKHRKVHGTR